VRISVVIPTNRRSLAASARVLEAASLDAEKFEVIVRDNSGDEKKRALLSSIRSPALCVFTVPNKGPTENFIEAQRLASGDFVYLVGDDDWFSTRGLDQLHTRMVSVYDDQTFESGTGDYLIETSTQTGFLRYANLECPSSHERLVGYLNARAPNVLFYSAVRKPLALRCASFLESLPYKLSFHDQLISLIYLAAGRIATIERVVYQYDLGTWETSHGTLNKDRATYRDAGLPIEIDRLHWLICGLEGALLLRSKFLSEFPFERELDSSLWFRTNLAHFRHATREAGYAAGPINDASQRLRDKWLAESEPNLNELLLDISDVLELADPAGAERYFSYWSTI
jgi:glycosyltransferase involved in cell wall biosynthesis